MLKYINSKSFHTKLLNFFIKIGNGSMKNHILLYSFCFIVIASTKPAYAMDRCGPSFDPHAECTTPPPNMSQPSAGLISPDRKLLKAVDEVAQEGVKIESPGKLKKALLSSPYTATREIRKRTHQVYNHSIRANLKNSWGSPARKSARHRVEVARTTAAPYARRQEMLNEARMTAAILLSPSLITRNTQPRTINFMHQLYHLKSERVKAAHNDFEVSEGLPRNQRWFDRMYNLKHIIEGSNQGGCHVFNTDPRWRTSGPTGAFQPIVNTKTGVMYAWPVHPMDRSAQMFCPPEPKALFPRTISAENCIDFFNSVIDNGLFTDASTPYPNQRRFCGSPTNLPMTNIEMVSVGNPRNPSDFLDVITAYPIFANSVWRENTMLELATIHNTVTGQMLTLQLDPREARRLAIESLAPTFRLPSANGDFNPLRYTNAYSTIVDLAPILKRKHENGEPTIWDALPNSVIPCGFYVEFPTAELQTP